MNFNKCNNSYSDNKILNNNYKYLIYKKIQIHINNNFSNKKINLIKIIFIKNQKFNIEETKYTINLNIILILYNNNIDKRNNAKLILI